MFERQDESKQEADNDADEKNVRGVAAAGAQREPVAAQEDRDGDDRQYVDDMSGSG